MGYWGFPASDEVLEEMGWRRRGEEVGGEEEEEVCRAKKMLIHVCTKQRSRRPFLVKGLRKNKQSSDPMVCPLSARRRHKRSRSTSCKKTNSTLVFGKRKRTFQNDFFVYEKKKDIFDKLGYCDFLRSL
ncbi:hypothetical protein Hanom_Chr02g00128991 [Helianthus anomalus]